MIKIEIILALAVWLATGLAIARIYFKAGFKDTPQFIFWVPGLNLAFLLYLAFAQWPNFTEK